MKKTLTMILALVLITLCSTSAFAQKHRHTDLSGDNKKEEVSNTSTLTNEKLDTITLVDTKGLKVSVTTDEIENIDNLMEELNKVINKFDQNKAEYEPMDNSMNDTEEGMLLGKLNETVGRLGEGRFFDYALLIPIIAVIGFFFAPVLIIGFILLYRYKRRKQRDQVVVAAINKGVDIPEGYGNDYNKTTNTVSQSTDKEYLNKGIKRITIGIGIWILGAAINFGLLMGIGLFIVVLGGGELLIHYFNNRGNGSRNEGNYNQKPTNTDSLQKQEGTYEKSE